MSSRAGTKRKAAASNEAKKNKQTKEQATKKTTNKRAKVNKQEKEEQTKVAEEVKEEVKPVLPLAPSVDVIVFGSGEVGQLGLGNEVLEKKKPALIQPLKNKPVLKMAVGGLHVALIIQNEDDPNNTSLWTWGCNDQSVLGRVTPSSEDEDDEDLSMAPGLVEALEGKNIREVTTGEYHMAALDDEGRIYLWGTFKDQESFLGYSKSQKDLQGVPVFYSGMKDAKIKMMASGHNHILVLTEKGQLYSWGFSWIGRRVSSRLKRDNLQPARVDIPPHSNPPRVKAIYAAGYHNFVCTEDDKVFSWGLNNAGQLGLNDEEPRAIPTEVVSLRGEKIVSMAGGQHHSLALTEDGKIFVFGRGTYGQLGLGNTDNAFVPTLLPLTFLDAGDKVVNVAAGDSHSMCITERGKLYTWGFNERYQLGTGLEQDELTPKNIPFKGYDIVAAGGGGQHTTLLGRKKEVQED